MGLWFDTYKITKPIRLIELFAGIGAQAKALENLGVNFEHWKICEFDKYPVCSYNAIHHTNFLPSDITKIHAEDLEIEDIDKYEYIMTYSFPCGLRGEKIKTETGYKNIEDVEVGDYVLTHTNTYKKVVKTMTRQTQGYYRIKYLGGESLLTSEHPLYVYRDSKFQWIKVKDLKLTDKVSFNVNNKEIDVNLSNEYLWLLGRYVADGWVNKYLYNSVEFAIGNKKEDEFLNKIPQDFRDRFKKFQKECLEYRIADKELQKYCLQFGQGAKNKKIPEWVFNLPKDKLQSFFDGYISGDGHIRFRGKSKEIMFATTSFELFLGLQLIIAKLYSKICSMYVRKDNRKETFNDTYNCQVTLSSSGAWQEVIEDKIVTRISELEYIDELVDVFNFEVETDNSYTVNNIIVHNCQDLSLAGNRKGMSRESGTRSGLLWEVERLLKECNEKSNLPQILLMENVPQVIGEGNKKDFDEWYNFLASLGYSSKYKILNSKDFGIPQNRQRCYMVSILGDYEYEFPSGFPLKLTLRDLLEKNVDEKYYLSEKMIESFTYNSQKQKEKGNGFKFEPTNGEGVAKTITTLAGNRMDDNFLFGNENLNETLEKNKDKLGNDVLSIDAYNKSVHKDISQTITTRVSDSNQHFLYEGVCIDDKFPGSREPRYYNNEVPTIDTHTQLKIVEKSIPIKENTKKGYKEAHVGDGVYTNRVDVKRGTVQKDMIQTITTSPNDIGVVVEDERFKESALKTFNDNECKEGDTIDAYNQKVNDTGISPTITTRPEGFKTAILPVVKDKNKVIKEGNYMPSGHNSASVVSKDGIAPTVMENHGTVTAIKEEYLGTYNYNDSDKFIGDRNRENIGKEVSSAVLTHHQDGVIVGSTQKHADVREDGISPSLTSAMGMGGGQVPMHNYDLRIRKLTPKECWRLMGFEDIDFDNAKRALNDTFYNGEDRSNSQLYKQAGNSIVVNVLMAIFKQLF